MKKHEKNISKTHSDSYFFVGQKGSIAWQPAINLITGPYHEKIILSPHGLFLHIWRMSCGNCAPLQAEVKAAPSQRLRPGRWGQWKSPR